MLHGWVAALGCRFLTEAHEGGADERLQFRFALDGQLVPQAANRIHQSAAIAAAIQFGKVRQADGGGTARFGRFHADTCGIVHQDFVYGFQFAAAQHIFKESAHIPRRHAPGFVRGEYFFLVFFRNLLPEFLIQ